jgi:hypothetical protein
MDICTGRSNVHAGDMTVSFREADFCCIATNLSFIGTKFSFIRTKLHGAHMDICTGGATLHVGDMAAAPKVTEQN